MKCVLGLKATCLVLATVAACFIGGRDANAALIFKMRVTIDGGTPVVITDNNVFDDVELGAGGGTDTNATAGVIDYTVGGATITISTNSAVSTTAPQLSLSVNATAHAGFSSIKVEIVDSNFAPPVAPFISLAASNLGVLPVQVNGYLDASEGHLFSTGFIGGTPPVVGGTTFTGFAVTPPLAGDFSLGLTANVNVPVLTGDASIFYITDIEFTSLPEGAPLVPEPASLAVWGGLSVLGLVFGRRFTKKAA